MEGRKGIISTEFTSFLKSYEHVETDKMQEVKESQFQLYFFKEYFVSWDRFYILLGIHIILQTGLP